MKYKSFVNWLFASIDKDTDVGFQKSRFLQCLRKTAERQPTHPLSKSRPTFYVKQPLKPSHCTDV